MSKLIFTYVMEIQLYTISMNYTDQLYHVHKSIDSLNH